MKIGWCTYDNDLWVITRCPVWGRIEKSISHRFEPSRIKVNWAEKQVSNSSMDVQAFSPTLTLQQVKSRAVPSVNFAFGYIVARTVEIAHWTVYTMYLTRILKSQISPLVPKNAWHLRRRLVQFHPFLLLNHLRLPRTAKWCSLLAFRSSSKLKT